MLGILVIALVVTQAVLYTLSNPATAEPRSILDQQPSSSTPYMTLFNFQSLGLNSEPFLVYPVSNSAVWVDAIRTGPFTSQLINFTLGAPPDIVLNTTASLSDIIVDSQGRVWMAGNSLGYYDPVTKKAYNVTAFQGTVPQFMAIDNASRLWLTLLNTDSIGMYNLSTGQNATYPIPIPNSFPQGIAVAPDGSIWITEVIGAAKLARLDPKTSVITEYSSPLKLFALAHIAVDSSGVVWFTDHDTNEFGNFNPQTGEWKEYPIGYCPGFYCSFGLPNAMFVDQSSRVWFSEHIPGRIAEYDAVSNVLTEYIIPTPSGTSNGGFAGAWWASRGHENLVWFVAQEYNEIGYVNSSIPVDFNVRTDKDLTVERGLTTQLTVTINHQSQGTVSVGVNPSSLDTSGTQPSISGSFIQNALVGSGFISATIGITASWNAQDGSHVVMVTASDGQVAVGVPINVNVVEPILTYLSLATALSLVIVSTVLYVRRRGRRRGAGLSITENPTDPSPKSQLNYCRGATL